MTTRFRKPVRLLADAVVSEGHRAYSMEISYNRFERVVELPCRLTGARISSEYRNGMLIVRLHTEDAE